MTQSGSLLVCILPEPNADILRQYMLNAAFLARRIGADVHFLISTVTQSNLGAVANGILAHGFTGLKTVFHPIAMEWSPEVISEATKLYSSILIVVPSGGITEDNGHGIQTRKDLLEQATTPVLVLSPEVNLAKTPIKSVLIPMSGEMRVSSALKLGLRLASQIHVPVDLVHVTDGDVQSASTLEALGDQPHHDYNELLDRVLSEASPFSDVKERAHVRTLYHVHGAPAIEILKVAKKTPSCALVAEWHGSLIHGKAEILKELLNQVVIPIFLVKTEAEQKSVLKIGPEDRVA